MSVCDEISLFSSQCFLFSFSIPFPLFVFSLYFLHCNHTVVPLICPLPYSINFTRGTFVKMSWSLRTSLRSPIELRCFVFGIFFSFFPFFCIAWEIASERKFVKIRDSAYNSTTANCIEVVVSLV